MGERHGTSWTSHQYNFTREPKIANSTSRVDYRPHWDFKPDVFERRSALMRAECFQSTHSTSILDCSQISIPKSST
ncbi:hypothetical protein ILYODFUR_001456 [Ilyodon furcidens]|uniref:Uncharacterized protein n=1 Tax=Ilyodon furcidens TaxID=33524 RepID=A0ABV0UCF7_9TELE